MKTVDHLYFENSTTTEVSVLLFPFKGLRLHVRGLEGMRERNRKLYDELVKFRTQVREPTAEAL